MEELSDGSDQLLLLLLGRSHGRGSTSVGVVVAAPGIGRGGVARGGGHGARRRPDFEHARTSCMWIRGVVARGTLDLQIGDPVRLVLHGGAPYPDVRRGWLQKW